MKTYSHLEKGDLTRQLIAAGHLSGNKLDACNDLVMDQGLANFHTSLIELKGGLTGVIIDLIIRNPPSGRAIYLDLQKLRIEIPWCQVNWLERAEPLITEARKRPEKTPAPKLYSLPGYPAVSFAKNEVLNHRLSRGCVLLPGNELVGALMGVGERPLPDEFHDRQRFTTCLSVYYEREKRCDLQVDFMVEREPKPGQGTVFERVRRQRLTEQERNPVKLGDDLSQVCDCSRVPKTNLPSGSGPETGAACDAATIDLRQKENRKSSAGRNTNEKPYEFHPVLRPEQHQEQPQ